MNPSSASRRPSLIFRSQTFTLALLTLFAYGLLAPFAGFYWDDLPFAWIAKFLGPAEFIPAFAPFRPFLGPIFYFTTSLIPPVPLYWQLFALVVRFLIGFCALWSFKQIWRERPGLAYFAALLILVFPGYSQHWVAYTHINQELIPFIFYVLSFGFTFNALRTGKTSHAVVALLLQVCGIFPTEYFFGIEGLRFLLLFFHFQGNLWERFKRAFAIWLPYLLVWILNAAWLYYYYKFGPYHSYEVTAARAPDWVYFLKEALDALFKAGFYVWIQILPLAFSAPFAPVSLLTFGLILAGLTILSPQAHRVVEESPKGFAAGLIAVGAIGILLGRLPSLAAGLPLTLQSSYDRFMVSIMIGGTLFVLGVVELLVRNRSVKASLLALLVALGVGQQFFNGNIFRRDWEKQREIYWQLAWRIPALKPGTVILAHQMPIDYETDMSFTAPINWLYAPNFQRGNLPYLMLYTEKRLGGVTLPSLQPDTPIAFPYRTVTFYGNTSQAIVIFMPKNGCLRVLDPARGDAEIYRKESRFLTDAIPLSKPALISAETNSPASAEFFFSEPKHKWCYYFAKAELAAQQGDYQKVATLGKTAASLGYTPEDPREWLLFIEAYAQNGDLPAAREASLQALQAAPALQRDVCSLWRNLHAANSQAAAISHGLGCQP